MVKIRKINNTTYGYFDDKSNLIELPTLWAKHLISRIGYRYSKKTVIHYINALKHFLSWIEINFKDINIDDVISKLITKIELEDWLNYEKDKGLKLTTINNRENVVREFYKSLTTGKLGSVINESDNPYNDNELITKAKSKSKPTNINFDDLIIIINAFNNESERVITQLLYELGLRISELLELKLKDLPIYNPEQKQYIMRIRGSKGRAGSFKERNVIIYAPLLVRLTKYHKSPAYRFSKLWMENDPEKPVFLSTDGKPLTSSAIIKQMKRAAKRAGLNPEKFSPHKLRHSATYSILASDMGSDVTDNMLIAQEILGHNSIKTTEKYGSALIGSTVKINRYEQSLQLYNETYLSAKNHKENRGHK